MFAALFALLQSSPLVRLLAMAGVCVVVGFLGGYSTASKFYKADQVNILAENQKKFEAEVAKNNALSAALDSQKGNVNALTNTLNAQAAKIVIRPVYRNVCFDADGLHIANSALTRQSSTSGQSN